MREQGPLQLKANLYVYVRVRVCVHTQTILIERVGRDIFCHECFHYFDLTIGACHMQRCGTNAHTCTHNTRSISSTSKGTSTHYTSTDR